MSLWGITRVRPNGKMWEMENTGTMGEMTGETLTKQRGTGGAGHGRDFSIMEMRI